MPLMIAVDLKILCQHPRHDDPKHVVCEQKGVNAREAGESPLYVSFKTLKYTFKHAAYSS